MKKLISLLIVAVVFLASQSAFAAWTLKVSKVSQVKDYLLWEVKCTSDGNALTATDLLALMEPSLKALVQNTTQMILEVIPGTGSVQPDTTIDVTLTNTAGSTLFTHAAYSNSANTTGISLAEDYNAYLPVFDTFKLALSDIGTAGDIVTLRFLAWIDPAK